MSGGTAQPATETLAYALRSLGYQVDLDDKVLIKMADFFKGVRADFINGGDGGVQHIGTGFHALQAGHEGQAGGAVGVDDQGQLGHGVLDGGHQIIGLLGAHDTGHILHPGL